MTREELRDYVDEQRTLDNISYHVYSALIDGIDTLEQEPRKDGIILTHKEYNELIANEYNAGYRKGYDNGYCKGCVVASEEQEPILDKLRAEITTLQNRCYALTRGTMCAFCKYECEYKAETEDT